MGMFRPDNVVWTHDRCLQLTELWQRRPKLSTLQIAQAMGIGQPSVVGKVRRLLLKPRDNPVKPYIGPKRPSKAKRPPMPPIPLPTSAAL